MDADITHRSAATGRSAWRSRPSADHGPSGHRGRADERSVGAEAGGDDAGAAGEADAGPLVELVLGGREERPRRSRAPPSPPTTARLEVAAGTQTSATRPTDEPARCAPDRERRVGRRPAGARRDGETGLPRPRGSRGPRTRTGDRRARRRRGRRARRCPSAPSSSRPSSTMPPPDAGADHHGQEVAHAPAPRRTSPRRGPAPWRRCRRPPAARSAPPTAAAGGSPASRDVERRHELAAGRSSARRSPRRPRPDGAPAPPSQRGRHERGQTRPRVGAVGRPSVARPAPGRRRRPRRRPAWCRRRRPRGRSPRADCRP